MLGHRAVWRAWRPCEATVVAASYRQAPTLPNTLVLLAAQGAHADLLTFPIYLIEKMVQPDSVFKSFLEITVSHFLTNHIRRLVNVLVSLS